MDKSDTECVDAPSSSSFQATDLDRISQETFVRQIEHHRELASTNDRSLEAASDQELRLPLLVLSDRQTAGRGRGANSWWGGEGALTFSLLLQPEPQHLPTSRWPQASLTAGLAVCEALETLLETRMLETRIETRLETRPGRPDIRLKWPNDVYIGDRKVCGILVETPRGQPGTLVFGIGINVNNSSSTAPKELQGKVASLSDVAGQCFPLVDVLVQVLRLLKERLDWIGTNDTELLARWRSRCYLTERLVQVDTTTRQLTGICQGIDDDGALLLQTDGGTERCFSGIITLIEG